VASVPARLWILLLTVLLVAAPAGGMAAEVLPEAPSLLAFDDDVVAQPEIVVEHVPVLTTALPRVAETPHASPALARIFRPPRPTFD
jgi:hypothetical protein